MDAFRLGFGMNTPLVESRAMIRPARSSRLPVLAAAAARFKASLTLPISSVRALVIRRPKPLQVRSRPLRYPKYTTHPRLVGSAV